jgi:hypothetical protein
MSRSLNGVAISVSALFVFGKELCITYSVVHFTSQTVETRYKLVVNAKLNFFLSQLSGTFFNSRTCGAGLYYINISYYESTSIMAIVRDSALYTL